MTLLYIILLCNVINMPFDTLFLQDAYDSNLYFKIRDSYIFRASKKSITIILSYKVPLNLHIWSYNNIIINIVKCFTNNNE